MQQINPVQRFCTFFQRNVDFVDKISPAVSASRLGNICSNTGAAADDLFRENVLLMLVLQMLAQKDNAFGEGLGLLVRNAVRQHNLHSPISTLHSCS